MFGKRGGTPSNFDANPVQAPVTQPAPTAAPAAPKEPPKVAAPPKMFAGESIVLFQLIQLPLRL